MHLMGIFDAREMAEFRRKIAEREPLLMVRCMQGGTAFEKYGASRAVYL